MDVLEIGTGYTAALMSHRLGQEHVFSVDVEPALVTDARGKLDWIGYRPRLTLGDGADGWSEHAPYDRIIAICSFSQSPDDGTRLPVPGRIRSA